MPTQISAIETMAREQLSVARSALDNIRAANSGAAVPSGAQSGLVT